MHLTNLYQTCLIEPIDEGYKKLFIVSGYASATFARRHINSLLLKSNDFEINLIIGMPRNISDHVAFVDLHNEFPSKFKGYYYRNGAPVHSKTYVWFNENGDSLGLSGSANYSQYGFFENLQKNQMVQTDGSLIKNYFDTLASESIYIPNEFVVSQVLSAPIFDGELQPGGLFWDVPGRRVTFSFLKSDGSMPGASGLNWGQRPGREPNQAYLPIRREARSPGFLPELAYTFTLITDDGHSFDCVVAQGGRKAIHSTNNNSELGIYFRTRMGLPLGSFVTKQNLLDYGRTTYTLEKLDNETFLLDFSV
jgi:hypothetical protein